MSKIWNQIKRYQVTVFSACAIVACAVFAVALVGLGNAFLAVVMCILGAWVGLIFGIESDLND